MSLPDGIACPGRIHYCKAAAPFSGLALEAAAVPVHCPGRAHADAWPGILMSHSRRSGQASWPNTGSLPDRCRSRRGSGKGNRHHDADIRPPPASPANPALEKMRLPNQRCAEYSPLPRLGGGRHTFLLLQQLACSHLDSAGAPRAVEPAAKAHDRGDPPDSVFSPLPIPSSLLSIPGLHSPVCNLAERPIPQPRLRG